MRRAAAAARRGRTPPRAPTPSGPGAHRLQLQQRGLRPRAGAEVADLKALKVYHLVSRSSLRASPGTPAPSDGTRSSPGTRRCSPRPRWRSTRCSSWPDCRARRTTRSATRSRAKSPRDPLRRDGGRRRGAPHAVLRLGRRDAALPRAAVRVRAVDGRPRHARRAAPGRRARAGVDRWLGRSRRRRPRRLRATDAQGSAQPGLEGQPRRRAVRRWPPGRSADRAHRGAGVRRRRAPSHGRAAIACWGGTRRRRRWRPPRARSPRASRSATGWRSWAPTPSPSTAPAGRWMPSPRTQATCSSRASRRPIAPAGWWRVSSRRHVERLGHPDPREGPARLQPAQLSQRHGLATRQRHRRDGHGALRDDASPPAGSSRGCGPPPSTSGTCGCPSSSAGSTAMPASSRFITRWPALRRPGPAVRSSCSCARAWASSRMRPTTPSTWLRPRSRAGSTT